MALGITTRMGVAFNLTLPLPRKPKTFGRMPLAPSKKAKTNGMEQWNAKTVF
jgi:hypothetical protein